MLHAVEPPKLKLAETQTYEFHPLATMFPEITGSRFEELQASIAAEGLLHPITIWDGKVLDGRNRYRACKAMGRPFLEGDFATFSGTEDEARRLVMVENLCRRDLTPAERAMVAAELATATRGSGSSGMTITAACNVMQVGELTVRQAKKIRKIGAPHIADMVRRSELDVATGLRIASLPMEIQNGLLTAKACRAYLESPAYKTVDGAALVRAVRYAGRGIATIEKLDIAQAFESGLTPAQANAILEVCEQGLALLSSLRSAITAGDDGS